MESKFESDRPSIIPTGEATAILPQRENAGNPITIIGTQLIRDNLEPECLKQALNAAGAPGVTHLVINPDAHPGFGAPIGCVLVSPTHIYPGPVGVDVKCSMSLLQFDLPASAIDDKRLRRALIDEISIRTPTGAGRGQRSVEKSRRIERAIGIKSILEGASIKVCEALGIPRQWVLRCEDASHDGHDGAVNSLARRLERIHHDNVFKNFDEKLMQLGSYGGGNHFGECEIVELVERERNQGIADVFGLQDGNVAMFSHCGSRGFGNILAKNQFKILQSKFKEQNIPFPAGDRELVYAPLSTPEADDYLDDMALAANFATVNHLLINSLLLEAFQEVIPGVHGNLVYCISHNIARREIIADKEAWVHRKGATRAFPAGHVALRNTPFAETGHPILLPGNPVSGSVVMVAQPGAEKSCFSVNHGAGRRMGRKAAMRSLDQEQIESELIRADILTNCRHYPRDEAPAAYKDFKEVVRSVECAGLAQTVAKLRARFVVKDASDADD
jgi:tRNA-splicing ligase RtcB (3'-phosphate/5'-hydroxy nucleic acid ligase)